jgi:hypothetical protein
MPSSGRACRSESERSNGSLGTIFFARPAFAQRPVTVFLFWSRYSGCVWTRQSKLKSSKLKSSKLKSSKLKFSKLKFSKLKFTKLNC